MQVSSRARYLPTTRPTGSVAVQASSRARVVVCRLATRPRESIAAPSVDDVPKGPPRDVAAKIVVEDWRDLGRRARARDVRRDGDVIARPERMVRRQWLLVEDVQHGPADRPVGQRPNERGFVDHWAPRDVDEPCRRLHRAELACAYQASGLA